MPHLRDQAIVLRHWEFSETSQTVALFTREYGVVRGLAKGARRDRGSFCGGFEALTRGEVCAIVKPSAELATLTDWDLQEVFWAARRSLSAHRAGLYVADLLYHSMRSGDPHPALYDHAIHTLRSLDHETEIPCRVLLFQWAMLREIGFEPRLQPGAHGATLSATPEPAVFSPWSGGVVGTEEAAAGGWKVRADTLALLRRVRGGADICDEPAPTVARASRLLGAYVQILLERELPAHEQYFGAGPSSGASREPGMAGGSSKMGFPPVARTLNAGARTDEPRPPPVRARGQPAG